MRNLIWQIEKIRLDLKYTWKLSRNETDFKENLIIKVSDGKHEGKGEAAPNIRYGETPSDFLLDFEKFTSFSNREIKEITDFISLLDSFKLPSALRFGIESAYIDFLCESSGKPFHRYMNIPETINCHTVYTLPVMDPSAIADFYREYGLSRFRTVKLKVNQENATEMLRELEKYTGHQEIIIDANESWKDVENLCRSIEKFRNRNLIFLEQPMPDGFTEEYRYLKKQTPIPLMADESLSGDFDLDLITECFHGVNMKLMKAGSYFRGIEILKTASACGMKTMVGCMVETTLGILSGFSLASLAGIVDLDGFMLIKNEPFKLLREDNGVLYRNP